MIKLPLPQFWHQKVALIKVLMLHSSKYKPSIGVKFYDFPLSGFRSYSPRCVNSNDVKRSLDE